MSKIIFYGNKKGIVQYPIERPVTWQSKHSLWCTQGWKNFFTP